MQNPTIQDSRISTQLIKNQLSIPYFIQCLGRSRHQCRQTLSAQGIDSIAFGHWLAVPSQQLLLVFRHQHCVAIDGY